MSKTKLILCDIDEIVLNWIDGFQNYLEELNYKKIADLKHAYWVNLAYEIDIDSKILVDRFNNSEMFANLELVPGALEGINSLKSMGYHLVAISAVPNTSKIFSSRLKNFEKHFSQSPFDGYCFVGNKEKRPLLETFQPFVFIEDNPQHISCAIDLGIKTTGLWMPYNRDCENFYGKDDWDEIIKQIGDWEKEN
jgi:FMN phosphatase YigB (HAD superfamily)